MTNKMLEGQYSEDDVRAAFKRAQRCWNECQKNNKIAAQSSWRFFALIEGLFLRLRLWDAGGKLAAIVAAATPIKNPQFLLELGEFFYTIDEHQEALICFSRVAEVLNEDNQDIRIRALVGLLECEIVELKCFLLEGRMDPHREHRAREVKNLILQDLWAVSEPLQSQLASRINNIRTELDVLKIKFELGRDASALERREYP